MKASDEASVYASSVARTYSCSGERIEADMPVMNEEFELLVEVEEGEIYRLLTASPASSAWRAPRGVRYDGEEVLGGEREGSFSPW